MSMPYDPDAPIPASLSSDPIICETRGRRDEVEGPIKNANRLIELAIDFLSQLRGNGLDVRVGVVKSPSGGSELQVRINILDTVTRNPRDGEQGPPAVSVDDLPQL